MSTQVTNRAVRQAIEKLNTINLAGLTADEAAVAKATIKGLLRFVAFATAAERDSHFV